MAKPSNGLLAKVQSFVPKSRKMWLDALTVEQQEEIHEVIKAIREKRLDRTSQSVARLIIETYGLKCSLGTVRQWVAEQIKGGSVAKKAA
jgi:hypothetical protein